MVDKVQDTVTVGDVIRLALPLQTVVASGGDYRQRQVNWVTFLSGWGQVDVDVQVGDLVLLPLQLLGGVNGTIWRERVEKLVGAGIAGIIAFGQLPDAVVEVAKERGLVVLKMPASHSLRDIHQNISSLLIDRQKQTTERGMELYRRLSELSREGHGLHAMTETMSQLTGKIVVVQDKRLDVKAISPLRDSEENGALLQILGQREQLPATLRNRKTAAKVNQNHWQQVLPLRKNGTEMARLIAPIVSGDRARGYVSVIGLANELDLLDTLTVEHGAAACALEMAKAKAISEAKKGLRGDFLEGLLSGKFPKNELERLESRLDHDTKRAHIVVAMSWDENSVVVPSLRRLETAVNWLLTTHNRPTLLHMYGETHLCLFQGMNQTYEQDKSAVLELVKRIREHVEAEEKGVKLAVGMSGIAHTIHEWAENHRRAVQAMRLAQRLGLSHTVDYSSLGIYQLLTELEDIPTVQHFAEEMVGALAGYDQKHRSNLVKTLMAYFDHHGNISQTSESLFIHRNTLLYRLDRIQDLTGQNLDQADMRLALHLSLKLWQLRGEMG